jgi:ethanolamine permease
MAQERQEVGSVEYERAGENYLKERQLSRVAGPVLLWGLGVGYVISGEFFGWQFGLNAGGWGGLLIATVIMATLYVTMIYSIAEMSTMMPVAGGPYAFARRAFGPWGGYLTGLAVTIEYVLAPAVIAVGIGGYVAGFFAEPPGWVAAWAVPVIAYVIFVGINLLGARESLTVLFVITGISVVVLVVWGIAMAPSFSVDRLFDIPPESGGSSFLPFGFGGIIAALPAAGWFYLAIEGVPLAAEETSDPARDLPKGMILAMLSLVVFSLIALFMGPGAAGSQTLAASDNPLPEAAEVISGRGAIYWLVSSVGLTGLIASFFSIIFAYSRQIYALSRAGYLPPWLSKVNRRRTPHRALIVGAVIGFIVIQLVDTFNTGDILTGDLLLQMAVFAALISYVMMMASHIKLRRDFAHLERPYRTPGYPATPVIALVLSVVAMFSSFRYAPAARFAVAGTALAYLVGIAYFWFYSRHHLVADAPEEEFALIEAAEAELAEGQA